MKLVTIAVILQALLGLTQTEVKGWLLGGIGLGAFGMYLLGVNGLVLLFAVGDC